MVAPLRRYTTHSMRPLRAAVVWFGIGKRWPHGRLAGRAPPNQTGASTSRRCSRANALAWRGIGVG